MLAKEYIIKNLCKVKTIINWQVTKNKIDKTIKINQLVFIRDLVIEKKLIKYNVNNISIKTKLTIEITNINDYEEINLGRY